MAGDTIAICGRYYTIDREDGEHYYVYPYGGGFERRIRKDDPDIRIEAVPNDRIACFAFIDDPDERFPCVANPHERWNGWAVPSFSEDVARQIIKKFNLRIERETDEQIEVSNPDLPGEIETTVVRAGGRCIFDGWCWEICDDRGKAL